MFIAVTRIPNVPPQARERMLEAFRHGAQQLKQFEGFVGFELWTAGDSLEAVSRWTSREAMEAYTRSSMYGQHHAGSHQAGSTAQYDAEVVI